MNTNKIIGWTLGNDCPFKCTHCYSLSVRNKGQNLNKNIIDKITLELEKLKINSVVLGGNEPIFTNGINPKDSLLPYIIDKLIEHKINPIIISSGFTINYLYKNNLDTLAKLKHIIISIDSPFETEHNQNRGAKLFDLAFKSLDIAEKLKIPKTILLVAMNWNFSLKHIAELISLSKTTNSFANKYL
ncbi:MAG: radical SAM protein [Ignavibacteria bacterium]|nr:radical SAM protein [Ignavibacteria bacterium]